MRYTRNKEVFIWFFGVILEAVTTNDRLFYSPPDDDWLTNTLPLLLLSRKNLCFQDKALTSPCRGEILPIGTG